MAERTVTGAGGVALHVRDVGPADGPAWLFVHGFAGCGWVWQRQMESDLAVSQRMVALDLRGHGRSDAPPDAYADGETWAGDIDAVITQLGLRDVVLVGWSYGGAVITDYVRHRGDRGLRGVVLTGAVSVIGRPSVPFLGPEFAALGRDLGSDDLVTAVAALERLGQLSRPQRTDIERYQELGWSVSVPAHVRRALFRRAVDNRDVIAGCKVPLLLLHGTADAVILPAMTEEHARLAPQARVHWFEGAGHAPFCDRAEEFNRVLAEFGRQCGEAATG